MDGDGSFSKPTPPISRWQLITKKIASAVTYQLSRPIGHTSKVFPFSTQSKLHDSSQETCMPNHRLTTIGGAGLVAVSLLLFNPGRAEAGSDGPRVVTV